MRTESLAKDFHHLMEGFGLDADLPHSNERNASACPIDSSMLDEESEALIIEVYAKDFKLYGYDTTLARLPPESDQEQMKNGTAEKVARAPGIKRGKLHQLNAVAAQCASVWQGAVDLTLEMPPSDEHSTALKPHHDVTFIQVAETWGTSTANWVAQYLKKLDHKETSAITTVHARPVFRRPGLKSTHYLVSLRDPIDRFISAYQAYACKMGYRNSSLCRNKRVDRDKPGSKKDPRLAKTMGMTQEFFECFPKVADLAEQLDTETACGAQARSLLSFYQRDSADEARRAFLDDVSEYHRETGYMPKEYPPFRSHMLMGTCFYVGGMLRELARDSTSVYVVEVDEDLLGVPLWLRRGLDANFAVGPPPRTGNLPNHNRMLSDRGKELLRAALAPEYFANYMIRRMSVNKRTNVSGSSELGVG